MQSEPSKSARLLVVDDQESNLEAIAGMLSGCGYEILLAPNAAEALRTMKSRPVDLILLDVLMPGRDGFQACADIRGNPQWAGVPIIFLSAASDKDLVVRALELGAADYVTKPFNKAELLARVRTHLALKSARDQLKQIAEDKDELFGILAHDLKNHLGGISLSAQLLNDRALAIGDDRISRMAANVHYATEQTLAFVKEFLANAAADRGLHLSLEPVNLNQAAAKTVRQYADAAKRKGITLSHEGPANGAVAADHRALEQILDNLVSNALKFSPPGTNVKVVVHHTNDGWSACRVQDEGPGFTEEDLDHLYCRYRRLSARPTGGEPSTGLGLSIVRKLVDAMNGEVRCETAPGRGSAFTVCLPSASRQ